MDILTAMVVFGLVLIAVITALLITIVVNVDQMARAIGFERITAMQNELHLIRRRLDDNPAPPPRYASV